jgi:16S rRNA (guanine966-N2)-methyltransferase
MNARITAGFLKGRVIRVPGEALKFRPTLERAKISVADMVQPRLGGAVCADFCAGCGAIGFEMLSRGAARVDFIESDAACAAIIRSHAEEFGVAAKCRIFEQNVERYIQSCEESYTILFFDPPYNIYALRNCIGPLLRLVRSDGILLYQRQRSGLKPDAVGQEPIQPIDVRRYGNSVVEVYRPAKG